MATMAAERAARMRGYYRRLARADERGDDDALVALELELGEAQSYLYDGVTAEHDGIDDGQPTLLAYPDGSILVWDQWEYDARVARGQARHEAIALIGQDEGYFHCEKCPATYHDEAPALSHMRRIHGERTDGRWPEEMLAEGFIAADPGFLRWDSARGYWIEADGVEIAAYDAAQAAAETASENADAQLPALDVSIWTDAPEQPEDGDDFDAPAEVAYRDGAPVCRVCGCWLGAVEPTCWECRTSASRLSDAAGHSEEAAVQQLSAAAREWDDDAPPDEPMSVTAGYRRLAVSCWIARHVA